MKNTFFDTANTLYGLNLETDYGESLTVPKSSPTLKFDDTFGHLPSFRFLRASFVDYCGQVRLRVLPYSQVKKIFNKSSISIPQASLSLLPDDTPSSYTSPIGRWNMILDWSSVRPMDSVAPGHVSVMSWFAPEQGRLEVDPRTVLQQALESALRSDLKFLVGFESEFVLFDRKDDGTLTVPRGGHAWSNTMALTKRHTEVLDEIVTALEDSGIEVMMYHPESASCQFEIVTGPLEPMAAVDALYHTRQIIQGIAAKHNMRSTFHPKPFAQKTGTVSALIACNVFQLIMIGYTYPYFFITATGAAE